ncbi:MAG: hypothetical protein IPL59_04745 [Candidatus Competibacteraceae bacterium]|nr:hypothetical protein [Candidatus Competibacteraceae bacterium]
MLAGALLRLYLILGRCLDLPTHDHLPRASLGFFAIPQPHRPVQNLHPQRAFRAVAQRDGLPRLPRLLFRPLVDPHSRGGCLKAGLEADHGGSGRAGR